MKAALASGGMQMGDTAGMSEAEIDKIRKKMEADLRAQLAESEARMADMDGSRFEERLAAMKKEFESSNDAHDALAARMNTTPHISNLNEDHALSGKIIHFFEEGESTIGRRQRGSNVVQPTVALSGLSIDDNHASILRGNDNTVILRQLNPEGSSRTLINGERFSGERVLKHKDRLRFGNNHLYVFNHPLAAGDEIMEIDYDFAMDEIASNSDVAALKSANVPGEDARTFTLNIIFIVHAHRLP